MTKEALGVSIRLGTGWPEIQARKARESSYLGQSLRKAGEQLKETAIAFRNQLFERFQDPHQLLSQVLEYAEFLNREEAIQFSPHASLRVLSRTLEAGLVVAALSGPFLPDGVEAREIEVVQVEPGEQNQGGGVTHVVQPGENLFRIGIRYGVTAEEIAIANGIEDIDVIYTGQKLVIPSGSSAGTTKKDAINVPSVSTASQSSEKRPSQKLPITVGCVTFESNSSFRYDFDPGVANRFLEHHDACEYPVYVEMLPGKVNERTHSDVTDGAWELFFLKFGSFRVRLGTLPVGQSGEKFVEEKGYDNTVFSQLEGVQALNYIAAKEFYQIVLNLQGYSFASNEKEIYEKACRYADNHWHEWQFIIETQDGSESGPASTSLSPGKEQVEDNDSRSRKAPLLSPSDQLCPYPNPAAEGKGLTCYDRGHGTCICK